MGPRRNDDTTAESLLSPQGVVKPKSRWLQMSELRGITPLPAGESSSTDENTPVTPAADASGNPTHYKKSILSKIENSENNFVQGGMDRLKDVFQVAEEDDKENVSVSEQKTTIPEAKTLFEKIDE